MLKRIDTKMNKELVSKPYAAIKALKEELVKEQNEIVSIVKKNNDKYMAKIKELDVAINEILTDTRSLQDQYKKKISDIGKNLESTKRFRDGITLTVNAIQKQMESISSNCDTNHMKMTEHSNRIALKFAETTVDLKSASDGFAREIERV